MTATTTSRGVTFIRPSVDEKHEQANICEVVRHLGGRVYVLGTRRQQYCHQCGSPADMATRQTPGLPDLEIYLPPPPRAPVGARWTLVMFEVKGKGGVLSQEQVEFKYVNERAGVVALVGGLDAFLDFLRRAGWAR